MGLCFSEMGGGRLYGEQNRISPEIYSIVWYTEDPLWLSGICQAFTKPLTICHGTEGIAFGCQPLPVSHLNFMEFLRILCFLVFLSSADEGAGCLIPYEMGLAKPIHH